MKTSPSQEDLRAALRAAGKAHHDYESRFLGGVRDAQWPGWYAAYVLGRLGDFTSPTELSHWLEATPDEGDWSEAAASHVLRQLVER
jgi:hypothetical protein